MKINEVANDKGYAAAKAARAQLDATVHRLGAVLQAFPKGPMGLTPDAVKATPEYMAAKTDYETAFNQLRDFNARFLKAFPKEIRADRRRPRELVGS